MATRFAVLIKHLFDAIDGQRSIAGIVEHLPGHKDGDQNWDRARTFFERLWAYDQVRVRRVGIGGASRSALNRRAGPRAARVNTRHGQHGNRLMTASGQRVNAMSSPHARGPLCAGLWILLQSFVGCGNPQPAAQPPASAPASAAQAAKTDPLPSWNDGASKKAIVDFVARVTKEGGPDFVPPAERIATFDNDGTLWSEQPVYFQK